MLVWATVDLEENSVFEYGYPPQTRRQPCGMSRPKLQ
jgi:hypothetical protein